MCIGFSRKATREYVDRELLMDLVVTAVMPIFALILSGYVCGHTGILGPSATDSLNRFVVWLALPAMLFQAMAQIRPGDSGHWSFVAAFGGGMMITYGLSFWPGRGTGRRLADKSIEGLDAAYANTGFLGIPLGLALFGPDVLPIVIVSVLLTVCALFAVSIALIEFDLQTGSGWRPVLVKVGWSLLCNPLLLAPLLGAAFAATGLQLPVPVLHFTTLLGGAASPCALVTIGLFLSQRHEGSQVGTVARLVGLKLLVQPAVTGLLAFELFPMPPLWSHSALLLSALPIGTGPFMLAKLYDRKAADTSQAILFSTLLSLATISILVAWVGHL